MKFGKQLQLGIYEPWKSYYIQYNRLKRIILRKKFNQEKMASKSYTDLASMVSGTLVKPSRKSVSDLEILETIKEQSDDTPVFPTVNKKSGKDDIQMISYAKEEIQPLQPKKHNEAIHLNHSYKLYNSNSNNNSGSSGSSGNSTSGDLPSGLKKSMPIKRSASNSSIQSIDSIGTYSSIIDISGLIAGGGPGGTTPADDVEFFVAIDEEIKKINKFYIGKFAELQTRLDEIMVKRKNSYRSHHASGSNTSDLIIIRDIYVEVIQLQSYCDLNKTGFYKIIKKYDKTFNENKLDEWLLLIDKQSFVSSSSSDILTITETLTSLVSRDKLMEWEVFAKDLHLRLQEDNVFPSIKFHGLIISVVIFALSISTNTPSFYVVDATGKQVADIQASRCMSLVLFVVSMWITEAIPYFATSILIPVLVTFLGVLKDPKNLKQSMTPEDAANYCLNHIFNHTTMLLLGGYTISTAFSRCQLELRVASVLQELFGTKPKLFILAIMFLGLFLSMWISNHTAPILCATIILPIVRDLPTDSRFSKSLLLGLAFGCNFGGMMTPISSLQNALAVSHLEQVGIEVSFGRWIGFSLPFCTICTLLAWILIITIIQPDDVKTIPSIVYESSHNVFTRRNVTVIVISAIAILLFATSSMTKYIFGDIGVISLCVVGYMYGTGLLTEVDFNSLSWHTLFLIGGGNVLGKAVSSSGLLEYVAHDIVQALPMQSPWLALVCILFFAATVATFVSHTVAALILLPIISKIGVDLGIAEVTVIGSALAISAAMALPFSSFPNVNSLLIVDDFQNQYLGVKDFVKTGLPMSVIAVILSATLGYALITAINV